ncbi:DUF6069 family protein [Glycomyces sp. A-F 0318]|uniref:DUF6069 family protein n=1 Tax=Glycomyces amatae TaxID=2881355 RepID=UPI001E32B241|nr:DUF6069 family protein [Glycomyces amatae]MCD0446630.1 DUF6069 family protein [Glycomyces amatae]
MSETDTEARPTAPVWRARLIALVAAVAGAALTAAIAAAAGAEMEVTNPGQEPMAVGPVAAVFATLLAGGGGWIARALLDRFAPRRAVALWLVGAAVVFLIEMFPPFLTEATPGTRAALIAMHVVVAAILVPVFARRRPDREA